MNIIDGIGPGTVVHSNDGVVGTVEGHAIPTQEGETASGVLLVRSQDGARCYRVPETLIGRVNVQHGQQVLILQVASAVLEGYVAEVRPAADRATPQSTAPEEWVQ